MFRRRIASLCLGTTTLIVPVLLAKTADCQKLSPSDKFFLDHGLTPIPLGHQDVKPGMIIPNNATWIDPKDKLEVELIEPPFHVPETIMTDKRGINIFSTLFGVTPSALYSRTASLKFGEIDLGGTAIGDTYREDMLMQPNTLTIRKWKEYEGSGPQYAIYFVSAVYTTANMHATGVTNSDLKIVVGSDGSDECKTVTQAELQALQDNKTVNPTDTGTKSSAKTAKTTAADQIAKATDIPTGGIRLCGGSGGLVNMTANRPVPVAMRVCQIYSYADGSYACLTPDNPRKIFTP